MAKLVLKNASFYVASLNLSSNLNEVSIAAAGPEVDCTNFGSAGWYEGLQGLKSTDMSFNGFWESAGTAGDPDAALYSQLSSTSTLVTAALSNPVVAGDVAYFANGLATNYTLGGTVGEAARLSLAAKGSAPLIRGRILETVTRTATGNSAAYQLGATAATQRLYIAIHVTSVSGTNPTLDLVIESDNAGGFGSAATVATITQFTTVGTYYTSVAGAITDDYFRVNATVGGTDTPTFTYVVSLGIA